MYNRIRTIHAAGNISVRDLAFSQTCEMIRELSHEQKEAFWAKVETKLPNGDSVYLVREGV